MTSTISFKNSSDISSRVSQWNRREMLRYGAGFGAMAFALFADQLRARAADVFGSNGVNAPKSNANTSSGSRDSAMQELRRIPLQPEGRQTVEWVLANMGVYRRMPVSQMPCDPTLYRFCVENPDVVIAIWEVLKVTQLRAERKSPDLFHIYDTAGMDGYVQMLHHSEHRHVAFVDGMYQGSFFQGKIRGRGILLLASNYRQGDDGTPWVDCQMDAFFNVEPGGVEFLTRTLMPVVGKTADTNFEQTVGFLAHLSRTAKERPATIPWLAQQMETVPSEVRNQLVSIAAPTASSSLPEGVLPSEVTTNVARVPIPTNDQTPLATPMPVSGSGTVTETAPNATSTGIAPDAPWNRGNGANIANPNGLSSTANYSQTTTAQRVIYSDNPMR